MPPDLPNDFWLQQTLLHGKVTLQREKVSQFELEVQEVQTFRVGSAGPSRPEILCDHRIIVITRCHVTVSLLILSRHGGPAGRRTARQARGRRLCWVASC